MFLDLMVMALMVTAEVDVPQVKAGELKKVTNVESSYPFWSPDGSRIVFQSDRNGNSDIYIMKSDGTGLTRLTDRPEADQTPAWSPDGTRIVFQALRDGNEEIYVMNADGSNQVNVTRHPSNDSHPYWSPDGKRIIFNTNRDTGETDEVYTMQADGTDLRRLTTNDIWDTYASWSPDGKKILLRKRIKEPGIDGEGKPMDFNSEIFVMEADGSGAVNLSRNPAFDGWPSWSPDGRRILFSSNRSGTFGVYVMNADGSGVQPLMMSQPGEEHTKPIWSRDGKKIVCTRTKDGNVEIFTLDVQP
ncbi:MAG TPA: hypothetical protein VF179_32660 [Thermoanaerobaculia bacterium]|nr:hypothetical protein [Thermoanaerobaculia bacterium]